MEKKVLLLAVVVVVLCGSTAFALDPMGPPVAGLKQGQFSVGGEYSWSEMNIKAVHGRYSDVAPEGMSPFEITDVEMDKYYGNIGYGISDKWEVFVRAGVADGLKGDIEGIIGDPYPGEFDNDNDLAIGCGTKMTLHESSTDLKWGALAQFSSTRSDGKFMLPDYTLTGNVEIRLVEAQFAVGPTYQVAQDIWVYGGPFFHFVNGEFRTVDSDDCKAIYDLEEQTNFGEYFGAQAELEDISCFIEWQHNDDADCLAGGIIYRIP